jgi:hypothetical protein
MNYGILDIYTHVSAAAQILPRQLMPPKKARHYWDLMV